MHKTGSTAWTSIEWPAAGMFVSGGKAQQREP